MGRVLSREMDVQLVVSKAGNAALFYRGDLGANYIWAQFDPHAGSFQFVSEEGDVDSLGYPLKPTMMNPLTKTNEIFLIRVADDKTYSDMKLIKFCMVSGGAV